jgi:putative membrane protein
VAAVALVFGLIAGVLHIAFWLAESVWWRRPRVWRQLGVASQQDADIMAFGMFNQGYYNLFLGIGAIVGAILVMTDISGRTTLLGYCCLFMVGAAIVLYASRRSMMRAALIQGVAPAVALVALAFV